MVDLTVAESSPNPDAAEEATVCCLAVPPATQLKGEDGLTNFCGGLVLNFAGKLGRDFIRPFPSASRNLANWPSLGDPSNQLAMG